MNNTQLSLVGILIGFIVICLGFVVNVLGEWCAEASHCLEVIVPARRLIGQFRPLAE